MIVAYQNQIVMAETLTQALVEIFGRSVASALAPDRLESSATSVVQTAPIVPDLLPAPGAEAPTDSATVTLAEQARQHYERMTKAQRDGDWALYGEELKKLGDVLNQLDTRRK